MTPAPIVCAHNPYVEDRAPVEHALATSQLTGVRVTIAAVLTTAFGDGRSDRYAADAGPDETIESELQRLRDQPPVRTWVRTDATVTHALHTSADDEAASLIVVGSTRRGEIGRVLPGSTADRLLDGSCSVVVVSRAYTWTPIGTIGVGFINSSEGHAALAVAHTLAAPAGANLRMITALPCGGLDRSLVEWLGVGLESWRRASLEETLSPALRRLPAGVEIQPDFPVDDAGHAPVRASERVDPAMCGSRGYGPLRSALNGSVSRRLVDRGQGPMLVVPRESQGPLLDPISETPAEAAVSAPCPS